MGIASFARMFLGLVLAGLLNGRLHGQIDFKLTEHDSTSPESLKLSNLRAELRARSYIANPTNRPEQVLGASYFPEIIAKDYPVSGDSGSTFKAADSVNALVASLLIATEMQAISRSDGDDTSLAALWLAKQAELIVANSRD